jgi:hypothetical protein
MIVLLMGIGFLSGLGPRSRRGCGRCSGGGLAAVHYDDLTGQEAGVVGCEELDDIRDVIDAAAAAG